MNRAEPGSTTTRFTKLGWGWTVWIGWLVGIAAFALYATTAAPGIVTFFDDTLEFQTVAATWGIAHPTGYPLYTILGNVWTRLLPFGTWAGRLNLLSALFAAIAVGLVAITTSRLVTQRDGTPNRLGGIVAAIAFALGPVWWGQATIAEVYALHGAVVAAILATTIGINRSIQVDPTRIDRAHVDRTHFDRRMTGLMLLFGLGLTHHRTTLLLAPPVALYLLWSVPDLWRPRRVWWRWAAALFLPLILYLYVPWRAAAGMQDLNGSYVQSWPGFWDHVLARQYGAFFADNALATTYTPAQWFALVLAQTGWLALGLALLGLAWLVDRRWRPARAWWLVLGVLLANLIFALLYRVPDPEVFLLPALLCLAIFAGGGAGVFARLLSTPIARAVLLLLAALLIITPLGRGPAVNRHNDWAAHDQARRMAQADFPPGSHVVGLEGEMTALIYMQATEGLAQNATMHTANDPDQRRALIEALVATGAPVYLTRELEGIGDLYSFSGDAGLVRVWPRGQAAVPPLPTASAEGPISHNLPLIIDEGRVQIEGYHVRPITGLAQPALELILQWRVLSPTDKTLKLSLRLLDTTGNPFQWPADQWHNGRDAIEDRYPLLQVARTPQWQPNELIQDVHTVQIPPTMDTRKSQEESSTLLVIIYDEATTLEEGRIEIKLSTSQEVEVAH